MNRGVSSAFSHMLQHVAPSPLSTGTGGTAEDGYPPCTYPPTPAGPGIQVVPFEAAQPSGQLHNLSPSLIETILHSESGKLWPSLYACVCKTCNFFFKKVKAGRVKMRGRKGTWRKAEVRMTGDVAENYRLCS